MEAKRPDFEFDEFFFDDEEEFSAAKQQPAEEEQQAAPLPQQEAYEEQQAPPPPQVVPPQQTMPQEPRSGPQPSEVEAIERLFNENENPALNVAEKPPEKQAPPVSSPTQPIRQPGVRVKGRVTRRVNTDSILPQIYERVDDIVMYMYEEGLLKDEPKPEEQAAPAPQPMPVMTDSTMPLNVKAAPQPGASYVLVDALTSQMVSVDGNLRVGRDASYADLVPPGNNTVSAQHAELTVKQNVLIVRDIGADGEGSSNGTFINGVRIPIRSHFGVEAREGDIIEFSNAKYRVEKL